MTRTGLHLMLSTARMVLAVTMNMPQSVSLHVPATISMKNIMVVFLIVVMLLHASIRITVGVTSGVWVQHGIWQKKTLSVNTIGSTCWSWRLLSVSRVMTTSIIRDIQTTIRIWISSRLAGLTVYSLMVCSTTRGAKISLGKHPIHSM